MQTPRVIIVGSGVAGLSVARYIHPSIHVTVLSKGTLTDGATPLAQGGIAIPVGNDDSVSLHVNDTVMACQATNDRKAAETIIGGAKDALRDLLEIGFSPDRNDDCSFNLGLEGGHSVRRIVHAKDATGKHLHEVLLAELQHRTWVSLLPHHKVHSLLVSSNMVTGVEVADVRTDSTITHHADIVVIATGGVGALYANTTNPQSATGDGLLLAQQVNAITQHLDWIQWHPTALAVADTKQQSKDTTPMPLITEALRGAGALLIDVDGNEVVPRSLHALGCLAPRDVVTHACHESMKRTQHRCVYLDARNISRTTFEYEFPGVLQTCLHHNINPFTMLIPVAPAVHYLCGGIVTNLVGATSVERLYAVGECADAGFHGNNRLASNSLLEGLVMGKRCGEHIASTLRNNQSTSVASSPLAIQLNTAR